LKIEKFNEEHKKMLEKYSFLVRLSLRKFGLTSLENFPNLKNVQVVRKYNL